ncbi:hypothetical protein RMATCC62417_13139 [Rhizopus microsporus]|nr:hypothetical protein RMATCC62417_13139 [Rhizopus microsporus]
MSTNNSYLLAKLLGQLFTESRITNTSIYPKLDSSTNIIVDEYTPDDVSAWITCSVTKQKLLKTFSISDEKYKLVVRQRLETLRQGKMPSGHFAVLFESAVLNFPEGHCLDAAHLHIIYFKAMLLRLHNAALPDIARLITWRVISNVAISMEEVIPQFMLLGFCY